MNAQKILVKTDEQVAYITLNNPAKLNCIGFQMLQELEDALTEIEQDETVKVVLLQGAGERAFSTGADLKEFQTLDAQQEIEWIEYGHKVFNQLEQLSKPTIAFIQGYALGGGLEMALACDFRIGTESAVLGAPELAHGWLPGWGGMVRLKRLIGESKAKEVVFLSEKIIAENALNMGLLNRITTSSQDTITPVIEHLKSLHAQAFKTAKSSLSNSKNTIQPSDIQFDALALQASKLWTK